MTQESSSDVSDRAAFYLRIEAGQKCPPHRALAEELDGVVKGAPAAHEHRNVLRSTFDL